MDLSSLEILIVLLHWKSPNWILEHLVINAVLTLSDKETAIGSIPILNTWHITLVKVKDIIVYEIIYYT